MKVLFEELRWNDKNFEYEKFYVQFFDFLNKNNLIRNKNILIFSSVQFLDLRNKISNYLKNKGFYIENVKTDRTFYENQILGCNSFFESLNISLEKFNKLDFIFYIGDGNFHPNALLFAQSDLNKGKKILSFNPKNFKFNLKDEKDIEKNLKKIKGNLMKFYTSKKIGIFVSSKFGQERLNLINLIKNSYPEKKFFVFLGDNFNSQELDNFNFIECWINTACPRIVQDDVLQSKKPIVNVNDIIKKS